MKALTCRAAFRTPIGFARVDAKPDISTGSCMNFRHFESALPTDTSPHQLIDKADQGNQSAAPVQFCRSGLAPLSECVLCVSTSQ
ncbi:hypothetical protein [Croceibacterium ferulae]|uniref:hypothetical protein n=1 Tax=Croceibacterium ferulae TaxID=1854641 RepID=UPI000F887783|nr:hypothetical protein [Croceibacterium ferulae]